MTPSTTHPRQINHSSALASAEDDTISEIHAFYDHAKPDGDLKELEAIAVLTVEYVKRMEFLMGRLEYVRAENKHSFSDYLLDVISDELDHGAGAVVKAQFLKMESGK